MRDVAMVFQSYRSSHKTARANIEFPLRSAVSRRTIERPKAESAAEAFGSHRYLDRAGSAQRRQTPARRAGPCHRAPTAVFGMDEPLSNLDAKLRSETRAELVDLHRRSTRPSSTSPTIRWRR